MLRFAKVFIIFALLAFKNPFLEQASAEEIANSFITIVNPVRISTYTENPAKSLMAEYSEIRKRDMPATWLLTYDAITNASIRKVVSTMDDRQELGIFLEITENFSKNTGVLYNKTDGWQRATSVFLSGYAQKDRRKLIDKVFSEFKEKFGYYPKSVGGWWVDSYALSYMKEKYGITGVLGISDQYDLDGYQVWGTPWSTPFYPSTLHSGIPANDPSKKIDVVTFRWAARDPLNGYLSPTDRQASLYSTQDYHVAGEPIDYLDSLLDLYSVKKNYNRFAHLTIGSEADYSPETYIGVYARQMDLVSKYREKGVRIATMKGFSEWYRSEFPSLSPLHVVESKDLLGTDSGSVWIQGNSYRIGFVYNSSTKKTRIVDLRIYQNNFMEPFYKSSNKQLNLFINLPYIVDSVIDEKSPIELSLGEFQSVSKDARKINLNFQRGTVALEDQKIIMPASAATLGSIKESGSVEVQTDKDKILIKPVKNYKVLQEGITVHNYYPNIPFALKIRLYKYTSFTIIALLIAGFLLIKNERSLRKHRKAVVVITGALILSYLLLRLTTSYYVSQTEMDGLSVLSRLPQGNVLIYDKDCLRCKFSTKKPAAAAGVKNYVGRTTGKKTIEDYSFLTAKNSLESREILKKKSIDYVYLSKYEGYIESLPYLPQDLGLYRIYENANSEIWGTQ